MNATPHLWGTCSNQSTTKTTMRRETPHPYPPIRSGSLLGSLGQGKSHMMLSLLMGAYKGLHSRVITVSPPVHVGPLWQVWEDAARDGYEWVDGYTMFDHYDEDKHREIKYRYLERIKKAHLSNVYLTELENEKFTNFKIHQFSLPMFIND